MSLQGELFSHMLQRPCFRGLRRTIFEGRNLQMRGLR
jgi:hypothetical protein